MKLSKDDVRDIAALARVGVSDAEVDEYQKDLSSILAYFTKLQECNTDEVEEIGHITGMTNVYRADRVVEASDEVKDAIMENIPQKKDGYVKVKSVL